MSRHESVLRDLGTGLRAAGGVLNPKIQQQAAQAEENQVAREFAARTAKDQFARKQASDVMRSQIEQQMQGLKQINAVAERLPVDDPRRVELDQQQKAIRNNIQTIIQPALTGTGVGSEFSTPAGQMGLQDIPLSIPKPQTGGVFGKSISGRSQDVVNELLGLQQSGQKLNPEQERQLAFAVNNLTQERTQLRVDPSTGEQFSVRIKPTLPELISRQVGQPSGQTSAQPPSGGVQVSPIGIGGGASRKERQIAEKTKRTLGSARQQAQALLEFVAKNEDVTGVRGLIGRVVAGVGGQLGADVDTSPKTFARRVELLKSDLRSLIDSGRFSDEDRKRLDTLVSGLGLLDDAKSVRENFAEIMGFIDLKIQDANDVLGIETTNVQAVADEQARINNWTPEEKQRFIDLQNGAQ